MTVFPTIETGFAIPPRYETDSKASFVRRLEIGQSFIAGDVKQKNVWMSIAKKQGIQCVSRTAETGKYRIWRIK